MLQNMLFSGFIIINLFFSSSSLCLYTFWSWIFLWFLFAQDFFFYNFQRNSLKRGIYRDKWRARISSRSLERGANDRPNTYNLEIRLQNDNPLFSTASTCMEF